MGSGNGAWLRRMLLDGEILGVVEDTCRLLSFSGPPSPRAPVDGKPSKGVLGDTSRRSRRRSTGSESPVIDTIGHDVTAPPRSAGETSVGPERGSARPTSAAAADVREAPTGAGERSERGGQGADDGPLGASRRT